MISRGPGYLAVVWFGSPMPPPSPATKLDLQHTERLRKIDNLALLTGGEGVEEDQSIRRGERLDLYKLFSTLCTTARRAGIVDVPASISGDSQFSSFTRQSFVFFITQN